MSTFYVSTYGKLLPGRRSLFATMLRWIRVQRERQALLDLDNRLLQDIGLSRKDVMQECAKRFWQI